MDEITQLVRKDAQALVPCTGVAVGNDRIALIAKLGDGVGDRVVETAVERPKFLDCDRRIDLDRQIRYRLAKIAIVVNDLLDGKSVLQQIATMPPRRFADFGQNRPLAAGRSGNLAA
jgi:hypothetical protein